MSSILRAIGNWITGKAIPSVINFFVGGIDILTTFIFSCLCAVLILIFTISLITNEVIEYFQNFFNSVKEKYENAQLVDEKKIFEELETHKGEAANIETKLTFFDKNSNEEVNNLIKEENIEESKKTSMNLFINEIIDLIGKAGNGGENACQKNYNLYGSSCACLNFKYTKEKHEIKLSFTFYDEKLFEYLILLIKMLKKKGYNLEKKNYEKEFKSFQIDNDSVNVYRLIITNI